MKLPDPSAAFSKMTVTPTPHSSFLAEIERNKAVCLLVWKAQHNHSFDRQIETARRMASFEWTQNSFAIGAQSIADFCGILGVTSTRTDAEALVETARRRRVSLSELVAEQFDPDRLPVLRTWYRLASEAIRFEIRHSFSEAPRFRHLTTVLAEPDDNRAIPFETFGDRWRDVRHAMVLFTDVVETGAEVYRHGLPLNTLEAFLAQRASRILTTPIFWKPEVGVPRLFPGPPILQNESREEYFRRVAGMLRDAGAVKVIIDEASSSLAKSNH